MTLFALIKKEWFLAGMLLAIALAALLPKVGSSGGLLHLDQVTQWGIALVFFLHGIGLSPRDIRKGLSNWRLHLFIQSATFIIYPLVWLALGHWFESFLPKALAFGFCYLLVLPSTISSSVAMTAIAGGNVPGAIFNASLSSVLGIFLTPLYVQLFMGFTSSHADFGGTVAHIALLLFAPMVAGQLLRPLIGQWVSRYKAITGKLDKWVILLIVYNAFCDSVVRGIWHDFTIVTLLYAVGLCALILLFIIALMSFFGHRFQFSEEDQSAALFCGTKKSLAAGVPMAKVIFGANPMLGMLLLPIMIYHPLQIFVCALLANRFSKRKAARTSVG
ncbi:bile acid:sodium symporter family protein [Marinomonas spartinae]|uniref:bile acid:sodium symporter family protein n=1 Tax=Marinomonas spartinae TaxID=1792290 RepID=UPI0018F15587|nr:bile acid:sodium symporter family protein [Marinomonas spartinae]MBJ7556182.1 bile acid:sodium symporter [Marinomonas spartinae]